MTKYEGLVARKKKEYPGGKGKTKFSTVSLAEQFIPAFNSGKRIRVRFSTGEVLSGTVGMTGGWKPSFLLMLTSRSIGSSWLLGKKDKIVPDTTPIKRY